MKQNYCFYALLLMSALFTCPLFSAERSPKAIKTEIAQIKKQNTEITPISVKVINTLEKAVKTLDHIAFCLITGKKCTPRDRIVVSYALGFAVGASYNIYPIARLLAKHNIAEKRWRLAAGQMAGEMALTAANLKGAVLTPYTTALQHAILSAIFLIGDVKQAVEEAMNRESVLMFLKELSRYLAKDAQCIWSESYCKVFGFEGYSDELTTPTAKREALYFWMGFISGTIVKKGLIGTLRQKIEEKVPELHQFRKKAQAKMKAFTSTQEEEF